MLCPTHMLMAEKVFEIITSEFGIPLDHESLLKGSVAPDKKLSMIIIPHTKNQSLDYLNKHFNWLMEKSLYRNSEENREISYRLGIVIHFISDYFCTAHNDIRYLNPVKHYIYEKRLMHFFKKRINKTHFEISKSISEIYGNFSGFIGKKHSEYIQREKNMSNDLIFAMDTVLAVVTYVIKLLIEQDFIYYKSLEHLQIRTA